METLLFIGMLLITLLLIIIIKADCRYYFRAGLKSRLRSLASHIFILISFWVAFSVSILDLCSNYGLCSSPEEEIFIYVLVGVVFLVIVYFRISAQGMMLHEEGDLWKEIFEITSYLQRITGNIPNLKSDKHPLPALSKQNGIIAGMSFMTIGILISILIVAFKIHYFALSLFGLSLSALMLGLLLIILSIAYLGKERNIS